MRSRRQAGGSIAVSAAFLLLLGATVAAFVVDSGLILAERNRLEGTARAAAIAGAWALCDEPLETAAAMAGRSASIGLELGKYDEQAFRVRDPADPQASPNAIRVSARSEIPMLLRGRTNPVSVEAIGYLRDIGLAALGPRAEVRIDSDGGSFRGGAIHANGDVVLSGAPSLEGTSVSASGTVLDADLVTPPPGPFGPSQPKPFSNPRPTRQPDARSGIAPLDEIRPVDETLLSDYAARADRIYRADGSLDDVLYKIAPFNLSVAAFPYFDLRRVSGGAGERIIIFYDGGPNDRVVLQPRAAGSQGGNSAANITGVTFVSRGPIHVASDLANAPDVLGGAGDARVTLVSASWVELAISEMDLQGVSVRAGGDVTVSDSSGTTPRGIQRLRVVADGDIEIQDRTGRYDLGAGPVCPPTVARIGFAENAAR